MKKYIKPELRVEAFLADTSISSGCTECPTGSDCVDAAHGTGTYESSKGPIFCNYGSSYLGCD